MFLVKLTMDMKPHRAGMDVLLPDDVARRMIVAGEASDPRTRDGTPLTLAMEPDKPKRKYLTK